LFQWLDKTKVEKVIHPDSIEEISGHKDPQVVKTMRIKITNYIPLKTISPDSSEILEIRKSDKIRNDEIDTNIIKELFNRKVDYLITEDRGIHSKAVKIGIDHLVFTIEGFIEKSTSENPALTDYKVLSVRKEYFGNVDLTSEFFDSFKMDYVEFERWFTRKSDNEAYVCYADQVLGAFLYLKVEEKDEVYSDIQPTFIPKKRLKIGTFKVTSTGYRLGERFLKVIFDNAIANKVDEIYVTIFGNSDEQTRLISLLEDWGFKIWGTKTTNNGIEQVLVRDFSPRFDIEQCQSTYPFLSRNRNTFLVPIYPDYHTELLPDSVLNNESPSDFIENEPHRNAIRKTYISRSWSRNLSTGDVLLFYRTGGYHKSVITTIGLVESVHLEIGSESEFIELCRKRSVFDDAQLSNHWNYDRRNSPFIVNFHYIYTFPYRLNLARLIELGIIADINSAPRGFEQITKEQLQTILTESKADENYFID
jgi:hypothetical protein